MDFPFNVATLLPREINFVDNSLILSDWDSSTKNREEYQHLYDLIDAIGESSSFAQGLSRVITTAEKLLKSDHYLYLMTEYEANSRRTVVVGMLRIGRKKLFLLTTDQKTKEVAPLCVLDFYIHESRQRRGYGKKLFEHMLRHQDVHPGHMAIDKPSDKFLSFYETHYNLREQVPQINNFVVFEIFFQDRPIIAQEAALTQVNRSNRSSRTVSPDNISTTGSRRPTHSNMKQQFAGKPSRQRDNNIPLYTSFNEINARNMFLHHCYSSNILQATTDGFVPSVRCGNKHQTTLDWMRGGHPPKEGIYRESRQGYSTSRTPSYSGSPICRTPRDGTPPTSHPGTPPRAVNVVDGSPAEGSMAPTPATSPERRKQVNSDERHMTNGRASLKEENEEVDSLIRKVDTASLMDEPSRGKTGGWRDSISRSSDVPVEHMSTSRAAPMSGVLRENESVHGHLKFHHHALW